MAITQPGGATDQTPITTKPPAQPVTATPAGPAPVTPTPQAQSPLPVTTQQPVPPVSATDPLAFSGGTPVSAAAPAGPDQGWQNPFTNMSEAEKTAYWAGQGTQGLAGVGYTPGASGYDPAANAAATSSYLANNQPLIGDVTSRVQNEQTRANTAATAAQAAANAQSKAVDDANFGSNTPNYLSPAAIAQQNANGTTYSAFGAQPGVPSGNPTDATGANGNLSPAGSPTMPGGTPLSTIRPGSANDVGPGGLTPTNTASMPLTTPSGAPTTSPTSTVLGTANGTGGAGVNLTPTTSDNALTNQTISAGPLADRFKIAQDQYQAAKTASEPGYLADLREANRGAFGAGRGVSGMLRTTRGNIESDRQNTLAKQQSDLLNGALTGSIDDAYKNLGIAQQQQGFQNQQQQQAFGNQVTQDQLLEYLTNGAFNRGQAQEQAGYANDPSQIALILSSIFGNQATGAGQSAAQLFNQAGQASKGGDQSAQILAYLKSLGVGTGGQTGPVDTSGQTPGQPGVD